MKIRTTCPKNNKYYIRTVTGGLNGAVAGDPTQKYANVLDNCVGYANGRFNEIWNDPDLKGIVKSFHVQLVCNAENFIESAKKQGLKVSSTPVVGGIMVWQRGATLSGSDGAGHVAVVERVYNDGTIMTSESGWASWAFKTVRRDNSNGRWGQNSAYKFRGCIINPNVKNTITPAPKLSIDGAGGACTVRAMQRFFGTPMDGVISGQNKEWSKYYPALKAVEFGPGGSVCVKKLQKWVGTAQDGVIGPATIKAWQKKLGVSADGDFGVNSMKAWQKYLNEHEKAVYPSVVADPLQPWFDALKVQYEWMKDSTYKWVNPPTIANSKTKSTCIALPAVALQRLGLLPGGGWFYLNLDTGKINGKSADYVKDHPEIFEVMYPNKTIAQLGDNIHKGDIVAYRGTRGHIMVYMGKDANGNPLFDTMGNKKNHPIGICVKVPQYASKKISMIVRLKKATK